MTNLRENPEKSPMGSTGEVFFELNYDDLEVARKLASDPEHEFRKSSRMQAENMAESAQIELKPDEISLYCALREQMSPRTGKRTPEKEEQGTRSWSLGDQKILAAVLRLADDQTRFRKFTAFFSHIFRAEQKKS